MEDFTSVVPVISGFAGIVLGAVVSFFPPYLQSRLDRKREIAAVSRAIVTEIKVTLLLVERRRYIHEIEEILQNIRSGKIPSATYEVIVPDGHSPVFRANVEKIGILPEVIRDDVVAFHQWMEAAICDIQPGGLFARQQCGEVQFANLLAIAKEAVRIGGKVISAELPT